MHWQVVVRTGIGNGGSKFEHKCSSYAGLIPVSARQAQAAQRRVGGARRTCADRCAESKMRRLASRAVGGQAAAQAAAVQYGR